MSTGPIGQSGESNIEPSEPLLRKVDQGLLDPTSTALPLQSIAPQALITAEAANQLRESIVEKADTKSICHKVWNAIKQVVAFVGGSIVLPIGAITSFVAVIVLTLSARATYIGIMLLKFSLESVGLSIAPGAFLSLAGTGGLLVGHITRLIGYSSSLIGIHLLQESKFLSKENIDKLTSMLDYDPARVKIVQDSFKLFEKL